MTDILKETRALIRKNSSLRRLAREIDVHRTSLRVSLQDGSNPTLKTLTKVLNHLGYELRISKLKEVDKGKAKK